ncbi:MAG: hypothetical protein HY258_04660 [Chloroflexi bacterium]|nr:hypothetical protein [Chloroflexota bacterium]
MKTRLFLRTFSLLAAILISSCEVLAEGAPAVTQPTATPAPVLTSTSQPPTEASITATQTQVPAEAPTQTPLAVATSRGPNLEATDPTTVQLDSGGLQIVEFFRFT